MSNVGGEPMRVELRRDGPGQPWGFRLQGGTDFPTALSVQSVNPGSVAERAGIQAGDAVLQINSRSSDELEHEQAKQEIIASGNNVVLIVQRGTMKIWKPKVTPMSELKPKELNQIDGGYDPDMYIQKTSLAADKQEVQHIGSGYNRTARPFGAAAGGHAPTVPAIVNAQYNTPINLYSADNTVDTFQAQSNILTAGMQGLTVNSSTSDQSQSQVRSASPTVSTNIPSSSNKLNAGPMADGRASPIFHRASPVKFHPTATTADDQLKMKSAVLSELKHGDEVRSGSSSKQSRSFQMLQNELAHEVELDLAAPDGQNQTDQDGGDNRPAGIRSVKAPVFDPNHHQEVQQAHAMVCKVCGSLCIGVFVRIKGEPMHPECFKCCKCGKNLKNQGYFHIEGQMYCEVHAKQAAGGQGGDMVATAVYR